MFTRAGQTKSTRERVSEDMATKRSSKDSAGTKTADEYGTQSGSRQSEIQKSNDSVTTKNSAKSSSNSKTVKKTVDSGKKTSNIGHDKAEKVNENNTQPSQSNSQVSGDAGSSDSMFRTLTEVLSSLQNTMQSGFDNMASYFQSEQGYDGYYDDYDNNSEVTVEETLVPPPAKKAKSNENGGEPDENINAKPASTQSSATASSSTKLSSNETAETVNESENVAQSSLMAKMAKHLQFSEEYGPPLNENLAKMVEKMIKEKTNGDKLNDLKKQYNTPENATALSETKVNQGVWNTISETARFNDIKFQKVQKYLVKGMVAVANAVDDMTKNYKEGESITVNDNTVAKIMDGLLLLANANGELNMRRRDLMRNELDPKYRNLCAPSNPITNELFGDDLPKTVKDITDVNKISRKIDSTFPNKPIRGRGRGIYSFRGTRGNFRGSYHTRGAYRGGHSSKNYQSSSSHVLGGKQKNQ